MKIVGYSRFVVPALLVTSVLVLSAPQSHAGLLGKLKKKMDHASGKVDKATEKVTRPVDEANAQVDQAVSQATRPVDEAQRQMEDAKNQAMRPVTEAQRKMDEAKARAMAPVNQVQNGVAQIRQTPDALMATARANAQAAKSQAMRPVTMTQQRMALTQNQIAMMRAQLTSAARLTDGSFGRDAALSRFKLDALAGRDGKTLRLTGTVATAAQKLRAHQLAQRNFKTVVNEIRVAPAAAKRSVKTSAGKILKPIKAR